MPDEPELTTELTTEQELYAAWFTIMGVLINRAGGETIITNQEAIDAQNLKIERVFMGDGTVKYTGTVKEK